MKSVLDADRGRRNLAALRSHLARDSFDELANALIRFLPRVADPDMALNNLERLLAQPAARVRMPQLLESRSRGLEAVLHLLAASQYFADTLATYPEFLDAIRTPPRRNPSTADLTNEIRAEVEAAADDSSLLHAFRRFRARHVLRIGTNDLINDRSLEEVTRELARLADASLEVALRTATRTVTSRFGTPTGPDGQPARLTALAFGKLGGDELNYSSDIDLMFVYDHDGETTGRRSGVSNGECFTRIIQEVIRLLSSPTDRGFAYRVDLRLRPEGKRGPLARSLASTLSYYDTMGRTWERQALIKLRHVAGDWNLAKEFLAAIEPFVYRKYFSFAEINEVKVLKRQMEHRAAERVDDTDVKTGRGGIRDIEYTVQFLQLLNGGDLPAVRQRNTLLALEALEIAGCLTPQETYILADAYRFLRNTEHRLQLLFDLSTHRLPANIEEQRKLALRMGYGAETRNSELGMRNESESKTDAAESLSPDSEFRIPNPALSAQRRSPLDESSPPTLDTRDLLVEPLDRFLKDLHDKTAIDRTILNHLLHQTFTDSDELAEPEADLILDPDPDVATIKAVLGRYPFRDVPRAYQNLLQLAREGVPFLSARRCRHFLASIAPQLLKAVADTPDPDEALNNLERVSASLGAKAVLWELFSVSLPSLKLYVELCAGSPFLSGLLINNPGMVDELLDSLVLNQPRTAEELRSELAELCRGATDPEPILHSFQDKEFLRIGVGDLLGKADIRTTTAALSDVADTVLNQVVDLIEPEMRARYGAPQCEYVLLGLGKLGGREISYHSDLDLLLLYEREGVTSGGPESIPHSYYFTELAQRVIKMMSRMGPMGRLYAVDMRLRPTGKSGSLVQPLCEFERYFTSDAAQLWERQSLSRARVVRGETAYAERVVTAVHDAMLRRGWEPKQIDEIRTMRQRLEAGAPPRSLKRGPGGIVDVEFLVQMFQLKYGRERPELLRSNVWEALDALEASKLLDAAETRELRTGYSFLRLVEARLRIVTDRPLTEIPEGTTDQAKLARRLGFEPAADSSPANRFLSEYRGATANVRRLYESITARERATGKGFKM